MTNELIKIVADLKLLFDDWTSQTTTNEEDFLTELRKASAALAEELKKPQGVQKTIEK